MLLRSNFDIVLELIDDFLREDRLSEAQVHWLEDFRSSPEFATLPGEWPAEPQGKSLYLLRKMIPGLLSITSGNLVGALEQLIEALVDLPPVTPFTEGYFRLARRLADSVGGEEAQQRVRDSYGRYLEAAPDLDLVAGLAALYDPAVVSRLEAGLSGTEVDEHPRYLPAFSEDASGEEVYRGKIIPEEMVESSTFEVMLLLAIDTYLGSYVRLEATIIDETQGDEFGRLGEDDVTYADLRIGVPPGGGVQLARTFAGNALELRLVFTRDRVWDFSTIDGTLLNVDYERLSFSLRLPEAWLERDVPLERILRDLRELLFVFI